MFRVPNLLIIGFTFLLIRYFVFKPVYSSFSITAGMDSLHYLLMVIATILIAAAGYISNDYFDVVSDSVNKPAKHYIDVTIPAGTALASALVLSFFAIVLSVVLSVSLRSFMPALLLLPALAIAWWYAIKLKKSLMWGNIAVSGMSAGTIAMAWLVENGYSHITGEPCRIISGVISAIAVFAFLLSLMREIVKDMEDIEGDKLIHCRSLPIVKGIIFTKALVLMLTEITILLLLITQLFLIQFSNYVAATWLLAGVEIPLVYFVVTLKKSTAKNDFHKLSQVLKWIMLGGMSTLIAAQF